MTYVELKELNTHTNQIEVLGTIAWDGTRLVLSPPNSPFLQEVINEPIFLRSGAEITAQNPEQFLEQLQNKYRGSYLWATAPRTQ